MMKRAYVLTATVMAAFLMTACGAKAEAPEVVPAEPSVVEPEVVVEEEIDTVSSATVEEFNPLGIENFNEGAYDIFVESSDENFQVESCQLVIGEKMTAYITAANSEDVLHTMEVEALDIPLPFTVNNKEFTLYFVSSSLPAEAFKAAEPVSATDLGIQDGKYTAEVTMTGGTGRASIETPTEINIAEGNITATITWSSENYTEMVVGEETFMPLEAAEASVFEIPVAGFDGPVTVKATTTAMSEPHEIEYQLTFSSASLIEQQ